MLLVLFRFFSNFPLRVLHFIGAGLGWIVYWSSSSYRRRLRENLERANYLSVLPAAIAEAGKNVAELPFIWCAAPEKVLATAQVQNWDAVQAILDQGKGAIFLTPHLGCFEIIAQTIASRSKITVMYKPPKRDALKPLIEGARERENLLLAPANLSGVRIMAKALKRGEAIGLLPDQVPQQGEGVWAKFFGRPAYTMTLSAKLHSMTGAPIITTFAERLPRGEGFRIHFAVYEHALKEDAIEQTEQINLAMEALIAQCPAQYFWSYNRYKVPAGVTPPVEQGKPK